MKTSRIISAALSLLVFAACETKIERPRLAEESAFKAPVLSQIGNVIADQDNIKTEEVTFEWTPADFGLQVQIQYSVYLQYGDGNALLGQTSSTNYAISKTDYMGKLCNDLGAEKNSTVKGVSTFVTAKPAESAYDEVQSNIISYDVTTYIPTKRQIYLPGKYNGWLQYGCPFWETDGGSNIYKTMVDVSNTEETPYYFKLVLSDGSWTGFDKIVPDGWTVADESNKDCNYSVTEGKGKVWLSVNLSSNKISKTDITAVELRGSFDSWGNGQAMTYELFTDTDGYTKGRWTADVTFDGAGEMLLLLNQTWDGFKFGNGTVSSEEIEGGVILDQDNNAANIQVPAGSYTMKVYADRTPFVLVMNKK